jgi:hypothetical protein
LLHVRSILTGAIDAYLCRGNVLVSKRQTYVAKNSWGEMFRVVRARLAAAVPLVALFLSSS